MTHLQCSIYFAVKYSTKMFSFVNSMELTKALIASLFVQIMFTPVLQIFGGVCHRSTRACTKLMYIMQKCLVVYFSWALDHVSHKGSKWRRWQPV